MELLEIYVPTSRVTALNLKRAKTIRIPRYKYEAIRNLIIETLQQEHEVPLDKLIATGIQRSIGIRQAGQLSWLILQVKNDLEFRGHIQISLDNNRNLLVKLRTEKEIN